jgi:hypothetical protein
VTYDGTEIIGGIVPVDHTDYLEGQTVNVAQMYAHGPSMSYFFFAWNTQADAEWGKLQIVSP